MRGFDSYAQNIVCTLCIAVFVVVLLKSIFSGNHSSLLYAFALVTMVVSCMPQIKDLMRGVALMEEDVHQTFWWICILSGLVQVATAAILCRADNYVGGLVCMLIALLLCKMGMPYRKYAFYRNRFGTP